MALPNLLNINNITITHGTNGTVWNLVSNNNSNGYLEQIQFDESMFGTVPSGTIMIRDVGDALSDFNFSGKDIIDFNFTEIGWDENLQTEPKNYNFSFVIYQTSRATDFADRMQPRLITLKFIDFSYFVNERRIGFPDEYVDSVSNKKSSLTSPGDAGGDGWANQYISTLFGNTIFDIDKAKNYAWLKPNTVIHPSGRKITQANSLSVLNYLAENAINESNRANFFFWKDLHSVNFKSLDVLVSPTPILQTINVAANYTTSKTDAIYIATVTDPIFNTTNRIIVYKIDSSNYSPAYSFMDLENDGFFASYYDRIDPNFENPYFMLSDSEEGYVKTQVQYRVDKEGRFGESFWPPIFDNYISGEIQNPVDPTSPSGISFDSFNMIPGGTKGFVNTNGLAYKGDYVSKRNVDEDRWGFIDVSFYNRNKEEPSFSMFTDQGITMFDLESNRLSSTLWQSMYDIQELNPISGITYNLVDSEGTVEGTTYLEKNIIKEYIKAKHKLRKERDKYYNDRKLKEQWNLFKYVVCCMNTSEEVFTALIVGATAINHIPPPFPLPNGQGLTLEYGKSKAFKYAWIEVDFIPNAYEGISGIQNGITFSFPQFNIGGTGGCTCGFPQGISSAGITGVTFDYPHENFTIFIPRNARSGGFKGITSMAGEIDGVWAGYSFNNEFVKSYFPAYNLNEVLNRGFTFDTGAMNFLGPGINAALEQFPAGNQLIPIGYYPDFEDPCKLSLHGQLVKMYQVPFAKIKGISMSEGDLKKTPVFYYFDVQNAVEGQCEECD